MQMLITVTTWIMAHQALIAGAGVGILDLIVALIPSLQGNGVLHEILVLLKRKQGAVPTAPADPQKPA